MPLLLIFQNCFHLIIIRNVLEVPLVSLVLWFLCWCIVHGGKTENCVKLLITTVDWAKWYIFWADERVVAKNHVDSNYMLAKDRFCLRCVWLFFCPFLLSQSVAGCSFFLRQLMQRKRKIDRHWLPCFIIWCFFFAISKIGQKGI